MSKLGLLGLYAHPDDEQVMSGVFAKAAAEGIRTGLICATRGEMGEIADPALATPENLGAVREGEMRAAATVIGLKHLWFLDYKDSGMMGTLPNEDPTNFYNSDEKEALGKIVKIVREFRPDVMVTFDPTGGYGHPDHITINKLATAAFTAAADQGMYPEAGEPWQAARLFYSVIPSSAFKLMEEFIEASNLNTGFRGLDMEKFGVPDEAITNVVDVEEWGAQKERSLRHHRTQMDPNSPFQKMPEEYMREWRNKERFMLIAGKPLPQDPAVQDDLFAGLR